MKNYKWKVTFTKYNVCVFVEIVGLHEKVDYEKITARIKHLQEVLPSFKHNSSKLTASYAREQIEEEKQQAKWDNMNMGVDKWKQYLYPFGDITAEKKE